MKAIIETVTGIKINREIEISESPLANIMSFYIDDEIEAACLYNNIRALQKFMEGNMDETTAYFGLVTFYDNNVRADWKKPLCHQLQIMDELTKLYAVGRIPTFVVSIGGILA